MNNPDPSSIPFLTRCDVLVLGGSLAGIAAALALAKSGRQVTLVEAGTYLGTDLFATMRPWVSTGDKPPHPLLKECLAASSTFPFSGEQPLHPGAVKRLLEDQLLEAGVELLYGCSLVSVIAPGGLVQGVTVGTKGGLKTISCGAVLDATLTAVTSPASSRLGPPEEIFSITLEFEGCAFFEIESLCEMPRTIAMPGSLCLADDRVYLHRGCRRSPTPYLRSHVLVECRFRLPRPATPLQHTSIYTAARKGAAAAAAHLLWEHPQFRLAHLAGMSELLDRSAGDRASAPDDDRLEDLQTPYPNAWTLFGRRPLPEANRSLHLGERIGRALAEYSFQPPETLPHRFPAALPTLADVDVLVVGGGASGALAAIAAAQEGARTILVEMNPGLGGTGTYGGVRAYWMGRQTGFSALSKSWTDAMHDRLRYPHMQGVLPLWNITAKAQGLLEQAQAAGVELLLHSRVYAVEKDGDRVHAVLAATPWGPVRLAGRTIIDATGDGDVAALAGAGFHYGSRRDGIVMWYSLPQFKAPEVTQSNFTSMVEVSDPRDYTRAILWGRRRGEALHDHGSYLAPRESRHIHGELVQTLADQLQAVAYPDVICLAFGNNDMKGHTSSDWMKTGLLPPNLEIEIAYRMLVPQGLQGLLVVGKAISAERDALPSIRMQPDLENLGGAAGIAAAWSARDGIDVRQVDLPALQARLVSLGVLPESVLERKLVPVAYTDADIEALVEQVISDPQPLWKLAEMKLDQVHHGPVPFAELCCSGEAAGVWVSRALERPLPAQARRKLACALALMGSPAAVLPLVEELDRELQAPGLPRMQAEIVFARSIAPDHAAMPEAAHLLYALGLVADRRALPVWERVVERIQPASAEEVCDRDGGLFAYIDAVCAGAERLADPAAAPVLEKLARQPVLRGHACLGGIQPSFIPERLAYLELVTGRALARCGSPAGVHILISYLPDVRTTLARHAHAELAAVAGEDLGTNPACWGHWLESQEGELKPVPWRAPLEARSAWRQTRFRPAGVKYSYNTTTRRQGGKAENTGD